MPRPRSWTDDQLIAAVAASRTLKEVHRRLGLAGGKYDRMRAHIRRLGLDAAHLARSDAGVPRGPKLEWSEDDLRTAVSTSDSVSEVSRRLGYTPNGGVHRMLVARIRRLNLDTSHFTGMGWARGRRLHGRTTPLSEVLVQGSTHSSSTLRRRLVAEGVLAARCAKCGMSEWRGQPLPLHLDHINGDHTDNRLENLRILCPNCHSITKTWCNRRGRRSPIGSRRRP
jgi:hypothetical protein